MQAKKDKTNIDKLLLSLESECHRCSQPNMEEYTNTRTDCIKIIDSLNQSLKAAGGSSKYTHPCSFFGPIPGSKLDTYKRFKEIEDREANRELQISKK